MDEMKPAHRAGAYGVIASLAAAAVSAVLLGGGGVGPKAAAGQPDPAIVVDAVGRELMVTLSAEDCHRVMAPLIAEGGEYEGFSYGCFTPQ